MRDQGRLHGPSNDPVEFLRRRLAEHGRKLDDLYRRLGDKPPKIEPPGGATGNAFRAELTGPNSQTFAASEIGNLEWSVTSGSTVFTTDGVTLTGGEDWAVSEGVWIFGIELQVVSTTTTPTSGAFSVSIGSFTSSGGITFNDIDVGPSTLWYPQTIFFMDPAIGFGPWADDPFVVNYSNQTNQSVDVVGYFSGVRVPVGDVTVPT